MSNFELSKCEDGMKLNVSKIELISEDAKARLPKSIKNKIKMVFKPLGGVFVRYSDIKNQELLAKWIYETFGQGYYRLLYYKKLGAWRRRFARLCWIRVWDKDELGEYGFEITKGLVNLQRFGWFI